MGHCGSNHLKESSLQNYLCRCKDTTFFVRQNKYLHIYEDTYRDDCTPNLEGKFFLCHQNIPNVLFLSDHLPLLVLILLPTYQ